MGANQSHASIPSSSSLSSSSGHQSSSRPARSSRSSASAMNRSHAVRHDTAPAPSSGSYREFPIRQQQLLQTCYSEPAYANSDIFGDHHGYAAPPSSPDSSPATSNCREPPYIDGKYITLPKDASQAAVAPVLLSRTNAMRSSTCPSARPGTHRDAMLRSNANCDNSTFNPLLRPNYSPPSSHSLSSFASRMVSIQDMGCPAPASPSLAPPAPAPAPAPQYLVKPKSKNSGPVKSRFHEEF